MKTPEPKQPEISLHDAYFDSRLLGYGVQDFSSFKVHGVWCKAVRGDQMEDREFDIYRECTGRTDRPARPFREVVTIAGRRGGKSLLASKYALYSALFMDFTPYLAPGERGIIQVIAADRGQAKLILDYVRGQLLGNPVFAQYVVDDLKEAIHLNNSVSIEVMSCSFRSTRGRSVVMAICDEVCFWHVEGSAKPDVEVIAALRPGLATTKGPLISLSSPYGRRGYVYEMWDRYWAKPDPNILIWRAPTTLMNPLISQDLIDSEMEKDAASASSEWYAEWRSDVESFLDLEAIERCAILPGPKAAEPYESYVAFTDPSGGKHDAWTLAIGHLDRFDRKIIVDLIKAWPPPFNAEQIIAEITDILRQYRIPRIVGDRYGGLWAPQAFERQGIYYEQAAKPKSDLYLHLEPMINVGRIEFPKDKELIVELQNLERRTGRSGRDFVDHGPRGHDDLSNSLAGVCWLLSSLENSAFGDCDLS